MATALTATIDGGYTAPAVINVHFLDDGSGTGWENQGTLTDAAGHTFGYDGWTPYEQQQAELAFARFSAVANVVFNVVSDVADADFVMASGNALEQLPKLVLSLSAANRRRSPSAGWGTRSRVLAVCACRVAGPSVSAAPSATSTAVR